MARDSHSIWRDLNYWNVNRLMYNWNECEFSSDEYWEIYLAQPINSAPNPIPILIFKFKSEALLWAYIMNIKIQQIIEPHYE